MGARLRRRPRPSHRTDGRLRRPRSSTSASSASVVVFVRFSAFCAARSSIRWLLSSDNGGGDCGDCGGGNYAEADNFAFQAKIGWNNGITSFVVSVVVTPLRAINPSTRRRIQSFIGRDCEGSSVLVLSCEKCPAQLVNQDGYLTQNVLKVRQLSFENRELVIFCKNGVNCPTSFT